jgi:DNA polymerase IIIc chi subunit
MLGILIVFLSAISISVIAAGYSIMGLATLFAGAVIPIIAMGSALEVGKLVAASWLYNNWRNPLVPKSIKAYLTSAVVVLIFITSMGIFGFLSKAHLDQVQPVSSNNIKIELIDKQINQQQIIIDRSQKTLDQLDKALDKYIDMEYVTRGLKERKKQEEERNLLTTSINNASDKIGELTLQKAELALEQDKIEAEVGPIKYIAELIYGDEAKDHFDKAVRWVIIVLIFVFDPLAVLLLIAANISLRTRKEAKEEVANTKKVNLTKELAKEKAKSAKLRKKERDYKGFVRKLGAKELSDLDPDEIRLKLDQIMDWNEKSKQP